MDTKFGVLKYSSINTGDEIQSIAVMRFLPRIDEYLHREKLNDVKSNSKIKLIMNVWWMWREKAFLPSDCIEPLLISMHFKPDMRALFLQRKGVKDYLVKWGPVGCRDTGTLGYLQQNGVPAYFSSCLTTTLQRNPEIPKQDYILAVDVPPDVLHEIKKRTDRPVFHTSVDLMGSFTVMQRFRTAKIFLSIYQSAHCVVSPRLHVCLPCLAFETPALHLDIKSLQTDRFGGNIELLNSIPPEQFIQRKDAYDFENPPQNPDKYLNIRDDLIRRCSAFTGYNNPNSLIDVKNGLLELAELLGHNNDGIRRALYHAGRKNLIKASFERLFLGRNRFDLEY